MTRSTRVPTGWRNNLYYIYTYVYIYCQPFLVKSRNLPKAQKSRFAGHYQMEEFMVQKVMTRKTHRFQQVGSKVQVTERERELFKIHTNMLKRWPHKKAHKKGIKTNYFSIKHFHVFKSLPAWITMEYLEGRKNDKNLFHNSCQCLNSLSREARIYWIPSPTSQLC